MNGHLNHRSLFHYSKLQWLGTYLVALIAFFVIVVPSRALWGNVSESIWFWLAVLVGIAVVAIGISVWFHTHPSPEEEADTDRESVPAASAVNKD